MCDNFLFFFFKYTAEAGSLTQYPGTTSPDNRNLAVIEEYDINEFESPKETPQFWDIKF